MIEKITLEEYKKIVKVGSKAYLNATSGNVSKNLFEDTNHFSPSEDQILLLYESLKLNHPESSLKRRLDKIKERLGEEIKLFFTQKDINDQFKILARKFSYKNGFGQDIATKEYKKLGLKELKKELEEIKTILKNK